MIYVVCIVLSLLLMWMSVELREVRASLLREEARADGAAGDAALWKVRFEDAIEAQSSLFAKLVRTRAALRDEIERQHELRDEQTDLAAAHLHSAQWWEGCARANAINGERREKGLSDKCHILHALLDKRAGQLLDVRATIGVVLCTRLSAKAARELSALRQRLLTTL